VVYKLGGIIMYKKLCSILFMVSVLAFNFTVFAQGGKSISDWTNLPGYTANQAAIIKQTSTGINFKCDGYYDEKVKAFSGIVFNEQVDVNNFSIEFKANKIPGNQELGDDVWVGIGLLENKNCWYTLDPSFNQGMVNLIRPNTTDIDNSLFEVLSGIDFYESGKLLYAKQGGNLHVQTFKVEFKKNIDNTYSYYLNGIKSNIAFKRLNNVFASGKAYLYFGTSTDTGIMWDITITKLNGVSLSNTPSTASSSNNIASSSSSNNIASSSNSASSASIVNNSKTTSITTVGSSSDNIISSISSTLTSDDKVVISSISSADIDNGQDNKSKNSMLFVIIIALAIVASVVITLIILNRKQKNIN
jgi:hypothetical protein